MWRLRPVVELEPGSFGSCEAPWPGPWTEEQCRLYWRTCLAQAGITELEPIAPRSWQVFAEQIRAPGTLTKILQSHFRDEGIPGDPQEVSALAGGFALLQHDDLIVLPGCCGDLGNLADWEQAAKYKGSEPTMLWIGHPWLSLWCEDDVLCMREENEQGQAEAAPTFRVPRADLCQAIELARPEVDALFERTLFALGVLAPTGQTRRLAARLVGR